MLAQLPLDHIGIAVKDIEESIAFYTQKFAHTLIHREELTSDGISIAFLETGASSIELICPLNESSPVHKFITQRGPGMHHLCLRSEDIFSDHARLMAQGLRAIDQKPRLGARGKMIAFFHPATVNGVLLEICQHKK